MRAAEESAFEVLSPLILGHVQVINRTEIEAISVFAGIMFSMIDREHLPTSGVSQAERSHIFEHLKLPASWTLFIGRTNDPNWKFRYRHHGGVLGVTGAVSCPVENNFHACTVGFGKIVLHAVSQPFGSTLLDPDNFMKVAGLAVLHPYKRDIDFDGLSVLNESDIMSFTDAIVSLSWN